MKRRTMEGYWHEGKWMPGNLYFYVNLSKIKVNQDIHSKTKVVARPFLRDLEWEKAYIFIEARGFSGFEDDTDNTCWEGAKDFDKLSNEDKLDVLDTAPPQVMKGNKLKNYIPARKYLRTIHHKNLGKPLFQNQASNIIDLECFSPDTVVLMGDFSRKKIKDIEIGEYVMGLSSPVKVVNKVSGKSVMYELKGRDGRLQNVSSNHTVHLLYNNKPSNFNIQELIKKKNTESFKARYQLYTSPGLELNTDCKYDPYTLGIWLSDGRTKEASVCMTDLEPLEYLSKKYNKKIHTDKTRNNKKQSYTVYFGCVNVPLHKKEIPIEALCSTKEYRLQLLAGIIDGDGWYSSNIFHIGEPNEKLAKQYVDLAKSLGFFSSITKSKSVYTVCVGGNIDIIPTKIKRKQAVKKLKRRSYTKTGFHITELPENEFVGIEVDSEDNLFLLDDFTVVHNCRGSGKSYWMAGGIIAPTFLTDGMYDYDLYWENMNNKITMTTEIIVGAIEARYSSDLLTKVDLCFDNMDGVQEVGGKTFACPLMKRMEGAWNSGAKKKINLYQEKINNDWVTKGSGTVIHHRTFNDNPLAGNGTRLSVAVIDEVGFMTNLAESLSNMKDTTYDGTNKFGTIYMTGTGGENDPQAIEQVKDVFTNPNAYDCLSFDDIWEETGSIGFFVPYEMGLNQFKDKEGNTDMVKATKFVDTKRAKLSSGKSKTAINSEMMNNPRKPSEIFLSEGSNIFPIVEMKEHVNWLKGQQHDPMIRGMNGMFTSTLNEAGEEVIEWKPDLTNSLIPCKYPMRKSDDTTGCWVVWELPKMETKLIPYGLYIAGTDPYDQDKAPNSVSLGSTFIYKTFMNDLDEVFEFIVAEYTARPETAIIHHEQVRRGLKYFNARDLYENERNTLKMHFDHKNSLYLLSKTPTILKSTENSNVQRNYGIHMTDHIKEEIEIFTRDLLKTEIGNGKMNLHKINSIPLLEELIAYNKFGNFDRVIAFMLVVLLRLQNHRIKVQEVKDVVTMDDFVARFSRGDFYK